MAEAIPGAGPASGPTGGPTEATAPPEAAAGSRSAERGWARPLPALAAAAVFAVPFVYLLAETVGQVGAVLDVVVSDDTWGPLWRTIQLGALVTASCAVLGTGMAWLTMRADLPGRRVWRVLLALPLVIPSFVGANAFVAAFAGGGLLDELLTPLGVERLPEARGLPAAFVVLTSLSYPYVYLPVAARLAGLPRSLEESARLLGRGPWGVFRTVVVPQITLAVAAGSLLVLLYTISDFGAVQFVGYDTLTRQIYASQFDQVATVAYSLLLAVMALSITFGERVLVRRLPSTAIVTSRRATDMTLGPWKLPALLAVGLTVLLTLVAPLAVLGWWVWQGTVNDAPRYPVGGIAEPLLNTSWVGLVTAALTVLLVLPIARLTARRRSTTGGIASGMVIAGFALPGIVIALSLVNLFTGTVLYQTFAILFLAYVVHFGGQALRGGQVAIAAVPGRMEEAARLLGAGRWRRFRTVELPLMAPGLAAAGGLVLLNTMKELPATLLLSPFGYTALSTRIWATGEQSYLVDMAIASLVLVAVSGVLTWFFVIRRMEHLSA